MIFRFRPRYRGVALTSIGVGGSLGIVAAIAGFVAIPLAAGAIGVLLGGSYLASGTWRLRVAVDDDGFEVGTSQLRRFRLAWNEVVRVVVSESTNTCFIDGGAAEQSLLVPGVGAPAPYDIENRPALVAFVLAHVASEKIQHATTLESLDPVKG